jgi:hypothetical protein
LCRAQRARRDRVATASRPTSLQRVARLLLITRGTSMKDSNDNATLDWVDEANADNQAAPTGFYITENAALDKALNRIVNITLQDLLGD